MSCSKETKRKDKDESESEIRTCSKVDCRDCKKLQLHVDNFGFEILEKPELTIKGTDEDGFVHVAVKNKDFTDIMKEFQEKEGAREPGVSGLVKEEARQSTNAADDFPMKAPRKISDDIGEICIRPELNFGNDDDFEFVGNLDDLPFHERLRQYMKLNRKNN